VRTSSAVPSVSPPGWPGVLPFAPKQHSRHERRARALAASLLSSSAGGNPPHRLRPRFHRRTGPDRAAEALAAARRRRAAHLRRPRADRHHRDRTGLREALAACRDGDTLVANNSIGSRAHCPTRATSLTNSPAATSLGGSLHDPNYPVGRLLFNVIAMVAEFRADLIRMRTRDPTRPTPQAHHQPEQVAHADGAPIADP